MGWFSGDDEVLGEANGMMMVAVSGTAVKLGYEVRPHNGAFR